MSRDLKRKENDFLETRVSYGLIVRGSLEQVRKLKNRVAELDLRVIYQTTSGGKLWIVSDEEKREEGNLDVDSAGSRRKEF